MSPAGRAPSVCVAIPVKNGSAYLAEAIESVLAQTGVDLSVRVLDNGSDDDSLARRPHMSAGGAGAVTRALVRHTSTSGQACPPRGTVPRSASPRTRRHQSVRAGATWRCSTSPSRRRRGSGRQPARRGGPTSTAPRASCREPPRAAPRADCAGSLGLRLYASARRPLRDVPLFAFLGIDAPAIAWEIAPVETSTLPDEERLVVVHPASFGAPGDYMRAPLETFGANTEGLLRLYDQAASVGAAHVVYFSSAEVYGQPPADAIPTPESFGGAPTSPTRARSTASPSAWRRSSAPCSPPSTASRSRRCARSTSTARGSASPTAACRWSSSASRSSSAR